jgi:cellulose synthase (UDP-forming)
MIDRNIRPERLSNAGLAFLVMVPVFVINYLVFVYGANSDNQFAYIIQLAADFFSIVTVTGLWVTILIDLLTPVHQLRDRSKRIDFLQSQRPSVDVFIPCAGEATEIVELTLAAAVKMDYAHRVFILDDGRSDVIRQLAVKYEVNYIRRPDRRHAKSGNINNGLQYSRADFFAIIDADFVPHPNFLTELLGYMEDEELAFVQSPQAYSNTHNFIARGTAVAQEVFYRYVLPARNSSESVFCVGTNVIFRRAAIDSIGGLFELDHSEDIWTSLTLHERGWKSLFISKILAIGLAPTTMTSYFKQQKRWAQGGFTIFFERNPLLSRSLSFDQKLQYFYSSSFYFVGFSIFVYIMLPLAYLFFGISPIEAVSPLDWAIHYLPYLAIFYSLPVFLLGRFSLAAISTSLATFSAYIEAFLATVFANRYTWVTTATSRRGDNDIVQYVWMQYLIIALTIPAIILALFRIDDLAVTIINIFWALINAGLIVVFLVKGSQTMPSPFAAQPAPKPMDHQPLTRQKP